jgi:lysophospholipase L1-like esterase
MGPILGGLAVIKYLSATTNVVIEGNSLVQGNGATSSVTSMPGRVQTIPPVSSNLTVSNRGVNGWNIDNLAGNSAAIDALYVAGKKNVLVIWEGTNQIFGVGTSAAATISRMQSLVSARLAAHPWSIVLVTTLPRESDYSGATLIAKNNDLITYNNALLANYRAWGAKACVDVRQAGSPFANVTSPYADSNFDSVGNIWDPAGGVGYRVHLNDAGYLLVAQMVSAALRRLSIR